MSQNTIFIPEEATIEDLLNGAVDCLGETLCVAEQVSLSFAKEVYELRSSILALLNKEFG